jgi:hypothetical protein
LHVLVIPRDSIEKALEWIAYCRFSEFDTSFKSALFLGSGAMAQSFD